ncbi:hypothetical protein [Streptomyces sp. NPDC018055]|uniref:hypothetical protein n=1 Tax=Streptomyces sp. NPDC018055 TaxID=3365038 RepID=UPI0037BE0D15
MAKRKQVYSPWPENFWFTRGSGAPRGLIEAVRKHLESGPPGVVAFHESPIETQLLKASQFDMTWREEDGARIRGRLRILPEAVLEGVTRECSPGVGSRTLWMVTAEADRPWKASWQSPVSLFFPPDKPHLWASDWVSNSFQMKSFSLLDNYVTTVLPQVLEELTQQSNYTVVITHDERARKTAIAQAAPPLMDFLPPAHFGRVLEIRVTGTQDEYINEALAVHEAVLPLGGAVILPGSPRKEGLARGVYSVLPGADGLDALLKKTATRVTEYCNHPPHFSKDARQGLEVLDMGWSLPEVEPSVSDVLAQTEEARTNAERLQGELAAAEEGMRVLRSQLARAERDVTQARGAERRLRERPVHQDLKEAMEELKQIRCDWDAAQLLLDNNASEIGWLRGQLAQVPGRSYAEPAPVQADGPSSWEELIEFAGELMPHIRIGDIDKPLSKIRGHEKERLWLRRTWASLEALEAYAQARESQGASVVPNFSAYLRWPQAQVLVSTQLYCARERSVGRMGPESKLRQLRLFCVPEQGNVFMEEHFRIGGVVPPAPRMHIYDDLAGKSKTIHVGYIGPHLPTHADRG